MLIKRYNDYVQQTIEQYTSSHNIHIDKRIIKYTIKRYIHTLLFYYIYYTYKLVSNTYIISCKNNIQYTLEYIRQYNKKINNIAH